MPKLKQPYDRYLDLKILVAGYCKTFGVQLCTILGCSPPTALNRQKDPGKYTLDEINKIGEKLNIPIDEMRSVAIRYKERPNRTRTENRNVSLKACPCCGEPAKMTETQYGAVYVICTQCRLQTPFLSTPEVAEMRWNRRKEHK